MIVLNNNRNESTIEQIHLSLLVTVTNGTISQLRI